MAQGHCKRDKLWVRLANVFDLIFSFLHTGLWQRLVLSFTTQQATAPEFGKRSVLTLGFLCLPKSRAVYSVKLKKTLTNTIRKRIIRNEI